MEFSGPMSVMTFFDVLSLSPWKYHNKSRKNTYLLISYFPPFAVKPEPAPKPEVFYNQKIGAVQTVMIKFKANPAPTEGTWKIGETEVAVGGDQGSFKSSSFQVGVCILFSNNFQNISKWARKFKKVQAKKTFDITHVARMLIWNFLKISIFMFWCS